MPGPTTRQNCLVASGGVNWASASLTQRTEPKKGEKVTGKKRKPICSEEAVEALQRAGRMFPRLTSDGKTGRPTDSFHKCKKTFFLFSKRFLFLRTSAKFRAESKLTRSTFKITATKQTYDLCRIELQALAGI